MNTKIQGVFVALCWIATSTLLFPSQANADGSCAGRPTTTVAGGSGGDQIYGNDGVDVINSQAGHDFVNGQDLGDWICGGSDGDILREAHIDDGADHIYGNDHCDDILGLYGQDYLEGDDGNDTYFTAYGGCSLQDHWGPRSGQVTGAAGTDTMYGGQGNDYINGGPGSGDWGSAGNGPNDVCTSTTESIDSTCEIIV